MQRTIGRIRNFAVHHQRPMLLLLLPITMTLILASVVYVPALFMKPTHDFVYSVCPSTAGSYCYGDQYYFDAVSRHIEHSNYDGYNEAEKEKSLLFYYSISTHTSRPITLDEANKLTLSTDEHISKGYRLVKDMDNGNIFDYSDFNVTYVLVKGASKHATDIRSMRYPEPQLLGWVVQ